MLDLVEKYFKSDLTEAEQKALEETLLNSDEAALQFEALAKEAYARYGLPDPKPRWKDGPHSPFASAGGLKPWLWILAAGGFLAWGWWFLHRSPSLLMLSKTLPQPDLGSSSGDNSQEGKAVSPPSRLKLAKANRIPSKPPHSTLKTTSETRLEPNNGFNQGQNRLPSTANPDPQRPTSNGTALSQPRGSPPTHAMTPISVDLNPTQTYPNLSVVVGQSALGFLTVRVVNSQGAEIVTLYKGVLNPGNWEFEWDGKLPNGAAATPGFYQIEVRSGAYIQRKNIQIQ